MPRLCLALLLLMPACDSRTGDPAPALSTPTSAAASRQSTANSKATAFWKWFSANAALLHSNVDVVHASDRITAELSKVHADLIAEVGVQDGVHTLVLSANGIADLFPVVREVYGARPAISGWKVVAFRQRQKLGNEPILIQLGPLEVDLTQARFTARRADSRLDVRLYVPAARERSALMQLGFLILDHTLGEHEVETKVGGLEFFPLEQAPASARPISELSARVDSL